MITIFGGMLGSLLTIINPGALLINGAYLKQKPSGIINESKDNPMLSGIFAKNFRDALSNPSVSYETDKIVGMTYFGIIVLLTLYRILFTSLFDDLNLDNFGRNVALSLTIFAFLGIVLKIGVDMSGFSGLGYKSISHMERIKIVTVMNSVKNLQNLQRESRTFFQQYFSGNPELLQKAVSSLLIYDENKFPDEKEFRTSFNYLEFEAFLI